jgi:hypothetical protein
LLSKAEFQALCRQDFAVFFQRAWSEMGEGSEYRHNWHIDCVAAHLQACERGDIKRLIINIPPRTAKTLLVNVAFTAWVIGRNPAARVIGVSYAQRLSEKIAYKCRLLMETDWFRELFPHCQLDPNQSQKANFTTTAGGGRFSTSVGGTLTGEGGDYIMLDDPMNPAEALSDVKRITANEWVDSTVNTRLNDQRTGRIICIMQRLHSDDTTGHLLSQGGWHLLKLPAETKKPITIQLGKKEWVYDGLLHEERLPEETLQQLAHSMGSYSYAGQYLQEPVPLGGGEFKKDFMQYYASKSIDPKAGNIYITVDPANSKKKTSDYTAMAVLLLGRDQNYYLIDGIRQRLNPTERVEALFELHRKWNGLSGRPPRVGYERYGMMSDIHYIQKKQEEESYRFHIEELPPTGTRAMQKEERIRRLIPVMERRQFWLPNDMYYTNAKGLPANLMHDIVAEEFLLFPFGKHDDFIDAMSMIFDMSAIFPSIGEVETTDGLDWHYSRSVFDL